MNPAPGKASRILARFITGWVIIHFFAIALGIAGVLLEFIPDGILLALGIIPIILALLASFALIRKLSGARAMATAALAFTALNLSQAVLLTLTGSDEAVLTTWMIILSVVMVGFNVFCIRFFWWNKNGNPYRRRSVLDQSPIPVEEYFE